MTPLFKILQNVQQFSQLEAVTSAKRPHILEILSFLCIIQNYFWVARLAKCALLMKNAALWHTYIHTGISLRCFDRDNCSDMKHRPAQGVSLYLLFFLQNWVSENLTHCVPPVHGNIPPRGLVCFFLYVKK